MLLSDAHVEHPLWEALLKDIETRAGGHSGGDRDDAFVRFGLLDERIGEYPRVGRRGRCRFGLHPSRDVEFRDCMSLVARTRSGGIAATLLREDVQENRPTFRIVAQL